MSAPDDQEFINVRTLARRFDVSERTAWRWLEIGKVPSVKIAGSRRVRVADLGALVDEE